MRTAARQFSLLACLFLLVAAFASFAVPNAALASAVDPATPAGPVAEVAPTEGVASAATDTATTGTFGYLALDNTLQRYTYAYDDAWFSASPYDYDHRITQVSIRMAMAAFDTNYATGATDPSDRAANLLAFIGDLGFCNDPSNSLLVVHYPVPDTDTIGYALTSKPLPDGTPLVLVAIRGGGYGAEWGGDFELGSGRVHAGFQKGADQVLQSLRDYLQANGDAVSGCKVWICGFSKGAAVTNLVAAALDRGEVVGIEAEDVFARGFECPRITRDPHVASPLYRNIFNIENPIDLIPRFAPASWGYDRYGQVCRLPGMDETAGYDDLKQAMLAHYLDILDARTSPCAFTLDELTSEAPGEAAVLDAYFDAIASTVGTPQSYEEQYQAGLVSFAQDFLASGRHASLTVLTDIAFGEVGLFADVAAKHPGQTAAVVVLIMSYQAFQAHNPELCMAWVDSVGTLDPVHGNRPAGFVGQLVLEAARQ